MAATETACNVCGCSRADTSGNCAERPQHGPLVAIPVDVLTAMRVLRDAVGDNISGRGGSPEDYSWRRPAELVVAALKNPKMVRWDVRHVEVVDGQLKRTGWVDVEPPNDKETE